MSKSEAASPEKSGGLLHRLNTFLDEHVLPYPVKFLTNRVIILATLGLLVPLIFYTSDQAFVNALNSYLNVMSVVVSSTVLLYATIADLRDRAAAKRAEEIAKAYEQLLEERVQGREDLARAYEEKLEKRVQGREVLAGAYEEKLEERVQGREDLARAYEEKLEERVQGRENLARAYEEKLEKRVQGREDLTRANEEKLEKRVQGREDLARAYEEKLEKRVQGREDLARAYEEKLEKRVQADHELIEQILQNSIENILGGKLEKIQVEDHKQLDELQKAVLASNEALRADLAEKAQLASNESMRSELADLKALVQALYQSQLGKPTTSGG